MKKRNIVPQNIENLRSVGTPHRSHSSMFSISEQFLFYTSVDRIIVLNVDDSAIVHNHTCQGLVEVSTTGKMIYALCKTGSKQVIKVYRSDMQYNKEISLPLTGKWKHVSASSPFISAVNEDSSLISILDHQGNHQLGKVYHTYLIFHHIT